MLYNVAESRVETKTPIFIFAKSENLLTFHKISFCKNDRLSFRAKNFVFVKDFAKNFRFCENFPPVLRIFIHIQVAPESGSEFRIENFPENFRTTENVWRTEKSAAEFFAVAEFSFSVFFT
jgi:hypothetical protein